jgi:hypothetical protein
MASRIFYSGEAGGFYHSDLHGDAIPADAVAITAARHAELLAAQGAGRRIVARGGRPMIEPRSAPSLSQLRDRAVTSVKREAGRRIAAIAPLWRQLNALRSDAGAQAPLFVAIDAIRAASGAIEAAIATMTAADIADFDIAADPRWPGA